MNSDLIRNSLVGKKVCQEFWFNFEFQFKTVSMFVEDNRVFPTIISDLFVFV